MSTEFTVKAVLVLQAEPVTAVQLAKKTGMTQDGAMTLLRRLRTLGYVEFKDWGVRGKQGAVPAMYGWKT